MCRLHKLEESYFDGTIECSEITELYALLKEQERLTVEQSALMAMLEGFEAISRQEPSTTFKSRPKVNLAWVGGVAAAIAIGVVSLYNHIGYSESVSEDVYCIVNGKAITDLDEAVKYLSYLDVEIKQNRALEVFEQLDLSNVVIENR